MVVLPPREPVEIVFAASKCAVRATLAGSACGQLVLVIGDLHIPQRATDIPKKFKSLLVGRAKCTHVARARSCIF